MLSIPLSFAQIPEGSGSSAFNAERFSGLSSWFTALDGFLAESILQDRPETGYSAWVRWSPASRLPSPPEAEDLFEGNLSADTLDSSLADSLGSPPAASGGVAQQALDELAMIAFGSTVSDDGSIHISHLPVFVSAAIDSLNPQGMQNLNSASELHEGANPLRVLLSFLSALNAGDREAFRLLAGIDIAHIYVLLDFSGLRNHAKDGPGSDVSLRQAIQPTVALAETEALLDAERLLVSWRSSRLRSAKFQSGSLSHSVARSEAGRYLAGLLDTEYGSLVFNTGWAGERFVQDARQDLNEAWSTIGRAVAIDLRREAAPWLTRRLGSSTLPSFSLEYTVRPSPSNSFRALMTMRAVVDGISYGIPYQVAARALSSAAAIHFEDAPIPLRYVEEPLPGLRIYVPWNEKDPSRAIAELEDDLSAAYPAVLHIPSILLHIPIHPETSYLEVCIALDGAYREAATGVMLARSFSTLLQDRGYPQLESLITQDLPPVDTIENSDEEGWVD